jgi:hypothetical protein
MTGPAAGWYPDPTDASVRRWWDGTRWAAPPAHAHEPPLTSPSGWQPPVPMAMSAPRVSAPPPPRSARAAAQRRSGNSYAVATLVVCACYLALAIATRIVIFGILPAGMTVRSFAARERLAPVAAIATVIVVAVAISYYRR